MLKKPKGSPLSVFSGIVKIFFENFFTQRVRPQFSWYLTTLDVKKSQNVPLLARRGPASGPRRANSVHLSYCKRILDTLTSYCYFWALDMAPTYADPGLFNISVAKHEQNWRGDPLKSLKTFRKKSHTNLKGGRGALWDFWTSILPQNIEKLKGPSGEKYISKNQQCQKKLERGPFSLARYCVTRKKVKTFLVQFARSNGLIWQHKTRRTFGNHFGQFVWIEKSHLYSRGTLHEAPTKETNKNVRLEENLLFTETLRNKNTKRWFSISNSFPQSFQFYKRSANLGSFTEKILDYISFTKISSVF